MQIFKLEIQNYRGIKSFDQNFDNSKFVCFVGRGDSSKTTILKAIQTVLYPSGWVTIEDTDFYKNNVDEPISISVVVGNFSDELFDELCSDETYGGFLHRWDKDQGDVKEIWEEGVEVDKSQCCLKINFCVDKYLEPSWTVVSSNGTDSRPIHARDRARLNAFLIEDYQDRHFTLGKGSPLFNLYRSVSKTFKDDSILKDIFRDLQKEIDAKKEDIFEEDFLKFCGSLKDGLSKYNANLTGDVNPSVVAKSIQINNNSSVLLGDELGALSNKGKGTKRLSSIGIQSKLANSITLVDEIEAGLEPDRVKSLVGTLRADIQSDSSSIKQIFVTTHSRDVVVECDCTDIYVVRNTDGVVTAKNIETKHQGAVRTNPEAIFAKKILVCEGETEIGMIRALEKFTQNESGKKLSYQGVAVANGRGNNQTEYSRSYKELGYDVCQFCDSDENAVNASKEELTRLGVKIIDCENEFALEQAIAAELAWSYLIKAIKVAVEYKGIQSVYDSINNDHTEKLSENLDEWVESPALRELVGLKMKEAGWFKQITQGEKLGDLVFESYDNLSADSNIKTKMESITIWCES